ncbi:hypothetical protein [Jeotgalicoccus halotolerans]|uniref:Uncharacterized protein n=1 Tax=Jeotgalicoccus halotolerans TaxID=157227 RepID=A0A3E0B324_9STAP|nr:hypothetical protein [Jeotgalicoccus halotolerans]REG26363.1 hypothetical protein DFR63_0004 [Jeotgalicoccus halotolerans]
MSVREKKKELIPKKWSSLFMIACLFIGTVLGTLLVYFIQGEFPYEVFAGGSTAVIILIIIELIKQKRKTDNMPETDERVTQNVFNFMAYGSHIFIAVLFIGLAAYTVLGNDAIPTLYLWILFFSYIVIVGFGGIIIKRR